VVDPKWQIADYLEAAVDQGLRIEHILETHNRADHLSGRGRLRLFAETPASDDA
jgi:hydroxyacylglutathione hydrolase